MTTTKTTAKAAAKNKAKTTAAKATKAEAKAATKKAAKTVVGSIVGVPGLDDKFYHKFPRYAAYKMLLKAKGHTMTVANFLKKTEALEGVGSANRARGILQKLVDKKKHVGATCARLVA